MNANQFFQIQHLIKHIPLRTFAAVLVPTG